MSAPKSTQLNTIRAKEEASPGLLGLLREADLGLVASVAVVCGSQYLVPTYDASWYRSLQKPRWTPKNEVFAAVWIPLKLAQSVAVWLVWKNTKDKKDLILPFTAFGSSLVLGNLWNRAFFGRRKLEGTLGYMGAYWLSIAASIATFYPISDVAAYLLVPTQLWVTVAAKLNYDIVKLNKADPPAPV